jgi:hypothetical protein
MPSSGGGTGTPVTTTARTGMINLILRLRGMTEAAVADYSVDGVSYWTDGQLQDILDQYRTTLETVPLTSIYELSGGTTIFKDYPIDYGDLEESGSGVPYWSLTDSTSTEVTASYTVDYIKGRIRFASTTNGVVYFLKARSYDLSRAAAQVWREKMSHTASLYDFRAENQQFVRSQWFEHCKAMVDYYENRSGITMIPLTRSDL